VSLILEALRKLDREKETPERGFVVVTSEPWPTRDRYRGRATALALVAFVAVVATTLFFTRTRSAPVPAPTPGPAQGVIAPPAPQYAPVTTTLSTAPTPRPASVPRPALVGAPPASLRPAPASPPSLVLNAISERDGKPIALLGDRLVREGDEFDGVRVIRIGEAEVEIEWRGQRSVVRF
jgi:hypothetical protein